MILNTELQYQAITAIKYSITKSSSKSDENGGTGSPFLFWVRDGGHDVINYANEPKVCFTL